MPRFLIISIFVLATLAGSPRASAGQEIVDIIFARDVVNREPVAPYEPGAYCGGEGTPSGPVPIIDSREDKKVFLWNRIKSSKDEVLRHRWIKDGEEMAVVELNLGVSSGYRTWSSKNLDPNFHVGQWKVEVSTASDPGHVLCVAHFIVK